MKAFKLVIMVGFPGAGKTTWAEKFYPTFCRVSEDNLASQEKFLGVIESYLKTGKCVVADRYNHTVKCRASLLQLAKRYNAETEVIWVATPHKQAVDRLREREKEKNIKKLNKQRFDIYYQVSSEFEYPEMLEEGFDSLEVIGPVSSCSECKRYSIQGPGDQYCKTCWDEKRGKA